MRTVHQALRRHARQYPRELRDLRDVRLPVENRGTLYLESGIGADVREKLKALGHNVAEKRGDYGGYQAIMWDAGERVYYGASESRKDGQAAGY